MNLSMQREIMKKILNHIDEGIHVIDNHGISIMYNSTMAELEDMKEKDVLNRPLLEVFPSLNEDSSTLLNVLKTETKIINHPQTYLNNKNIEITTINTTVPIYLEGEKAGAIEIAKNITSLKNLSDEVLKLQNQLVKSKRNITFDNIIGKNNTFLEVLDYAKKAAISTSSVLIYGETGTGKELVAQSIHNASNCSNKPFIAQNCAAIPETLLESILFGTVKGGFTGAIDRPGIFEQADGGTVFLDELNSMGIQLQSKLLRVIQEGILRRIGGVKDIKINTRIIASTNEEPYMALENGNLRKDLFYRINVISIYLPPLRERIDDIKLLSSWFIQKHNKRLHKQIEKLDSPVLEAFESYKWPGNVRELENTIEGAMNIVEKEKILKKGHFSHQVSAKIFAVPYKNSLLINNNLTKTLETIEKEIIENTMKTFKGNISKTALELGIKRQTLQHKLKKYNIDPKESAN